MASGFLVDSHVHLHRADPEELLDHAAANFRAARSGLSLVSPQVDVLILTAGRGERAFERFRDRARGGPSGRWTIRATGEPTSLSASAEAGGLILVSGAQVATAEGLEILVLGGGAPPEEGRPLEWTVEDARSRGALVLLPWGFGKWWGARRRRVESLLRRVDPAWFFLGESGLRPAVGRRPGLLRRAVAGGFRVLAGTDPLPLPGHERRAGSFGSLLATEIGTLSPATDLAGVLRAGAVPHTYGRARAPLAFLHDQAIMQFRRRAAVARA